MTLPSHYLRSRTVILLAYLTTLPGCNNEPRGGPRIPTFPIIGQVLVDGEPANNLQVECHVTSGEAAVPISISGYTDADGRFSISTYEGGDGAPAGEYRLTFMWGQINLMTGRYEPPDKLNGEYTDPETSQVTVTVREGEEIDLGLIELTTTGDDASS